MTSARYHAALMFLVILLCGSGLVAEEKWQPVEPSNEQLESYRLETQQNAERVLLSIAAPPDQLNQAREKWQGMDGRMLRANYLLSQRIKSDPNFLSRIMLLSSQLGEMCSRGMAAEARSLNQERQKLFLETIQDPAVEISELDLYKMQSELSGASCVDDVATKGGTITAKEISYSIVKQPADLGPQQSAVLRALRVVREEWGGRGYVVTGKILFPAPKRAWAAHFEVSPAGEFAVPIYRGRQAVIFIDGFEPISLNPIEAPSGSVLSFGEIQPKQVAPDKLRKVSGVVDPNFAADAELELALDLDALPPVGDETEDSERIGEETNIALKRKVKGGERFELLLVPTLPYVLNIYVKERFPKSYQIPLGSEPIELGTIQLQ